MRQYVLRRCVQGIPVLAIVSLIVFLSLNLLSGDAALALQGPSAAAGSEQVLAELRRQMGLDRPIHERYVLWLGNALRGDLGTSLVTRQRVAELIAQRLPATLQLALAAVLLAAAVAVPAAILAAVYRGTPVDWCITALVSMGMAIPSFWLAIMLIVLFAVQLGWLPTGGYEPLARDPAANVRHLLLPAVTLAIILAAPVMRFLRSSLLEAMREEHVTVARSKGLSERAVLVRHVLRNAAIPAVTVVGLQLGNLMSGAVIVEWIFAWPGMGWLTVDAVFKRDYPVVQATVLLAAAAFVALNIVIDLLYAALDPRIRLA